MRLRFVFLAGAIFGGLLAYYVLWSHLIGRVEAGIEVFQAAQRAQGRSFEFRELRRGGFPYRLSLRLDGLRWGDPRGAAWAFESESLVAHAQLWNSQHLVFELFGAQTLRWRDAQGPHQMSMTHERGRASLVLDGADRWLRFAADIQAPRFGGELEGYTADRMQLHLRQSSQAPPSQDVAIQFANLMLPQTLNGPLGRQLPEVNLIGRQTGPWMGNTLEEMLANWRDAGGIMEFSNIAVQWGSLKIGGDGSLTVDKQFRPLGAMGGRLQGTEAGIDALVAAGKMRPAEAQTAKALLTAMQKQDASGASYLPLPLTAQDGRLSIANVPLFALAPLLTPTAAAPAPMAPTLAPPAARKP